MGYLAIMPCLFSEMINFLSAVQKKKNQLEKEWNSLKESMEFISAIIDKSAITEIPKGDKQACWRALIENEVRYKH